MQRPRRMLQQTVIKVEFFHIQPYNHLLPVCRHTNIQPLSQVKTCRDVTAVLSLIPCKWKKKTWSCLKFLVPLYTEKHLAKCYKFCIFAVSYWTDFLKRNSRSDLYCIDPLVQCEYAYLTLWGATGEADNHFNSVSTVMAAIFWVLCRAASPLQFTEHLVFFFFNEYRWISDWTRCSWWGHPLIHAPSIFFISNGLDFLNWNVLIYNIFPTTLAELQGSVEGYHP